MDGWKTTFSFRMAYFQWRTVGFGEGPISMTSLNSLFVWWTIMDNSTSVLTCFNHILNIRYSYCGGGYGLSVFWG